MKKFCIDLDVHSVELLNNKCALLKLTYDKPLPEMLPGQFVEVLVDDSKSTFLRRPISINYFDREHNELWLLISAVGNGTRRLCSMNANDKLNCIFPLGNCFTFPLTGKTDVESNGLKINSNVQYSTLNSKSRFLLVGGGVGAAPLLFLGKELKNLGIVPTFLLGARSSKDLLEVDLFKSLGNVYITTEDGSEGEKGFVTNHTLLEKEHFDMISTCGPKPMMRAVASYAKKVGSECEVSLENRMACGIGACLCCVEKTVYGNVCVCKEGPVFNISKLLWQDLT